MPVHRFAQQKHGYTQDRREATELSGSKDGQGLMHK